jgi:DNA-binding HxlR family transcriptional regulator
MQATRRRRSIADYSPATTKDYEICGAVESARRIGNQWRLIVIRYLLERPMRFNELLKVACGVDPKTLSRVLKYLAAEEIIRRDVLGTQPFTVRYALTDKGEQIRPIMQSLKAWGEAWVLPEIKQGRSQPKLFG